MKIDYLKQMKLGEKLNSMNLTPLKKYAHKKYPMIKDINNHYVVQGYGLRVIVNSKLKFLIRASHDANPKHNYLVERIDPDAEIYLHPILTGNTVKDSLDKIMKVVANEKHLNPNLYQDDAQKLQKLDKMLRDATFDDQLSTQDNEDAAKAEKYVHKLLYKNEPIGVNN